MKKLAAFWTQLEDGFVLVLTLLLLPAFLGVTLLMIDVGRVSNAHADLQGIADAAALAGGRELDGSPVAIANARLAMAEVTNSVSMLPRGGDGLHRNITFSTAAGNEITAIFLDAVPEQDTTPIDAAWVLDHAVDDADAVDAAYIYVHVQSTDFDPLFTFMNADGEFAAADDLPVGAIAVAKSITAACNVPPLYICNPFELEGGVYQSDGFQEAFRQGELHGRMIRLHPPGSETAAPGNFGFLQVLNENGSESSSADAIRDIFAGNNNPTCYDADTVTTKPGAANSIRDGINIRFDIFRGPFSNWNNNGTNTPYQIAPAVNVRKGYKPGTTGPNNACNVEVADDHFGNPDGVDDIVYGFPDDTVMSPPNNGVPGAAYGNGIWDIDTYLAENYGAAHAATIRGQIISSFSGRPPSRYDVYRAELTLNHPSTGQPLYQYVQAGGESGEAMCAADKPASRGIVPVAEPDRRVTFAALIDCDAHSGEGGGVNTYPVNSFLSIFMTRPMEQNSGGGDGTIDIEIIDVTGSAGNGTLDDFIRTEAVLIR